MPEGLAIEQLRVCHGPALHSGTKPRGEPEARPILDGVDLSVTPGEFVALVGPSGSGKTLTAMATLGMLPPQVRITSGAIRLGGTDLLNVSERELNRIRGGRVGMLFQQPKRMFNPRRTVASHIKEPLQLHLGLRGAAARTRTLKLLAEVGLEEPERCARSYAHQLSGGMAQRAMLAAALAGQPDFLLADEPTSALDKVLERQVMCLIAKERTDRGLGVLYITHDLASVARFADRVLVMEAGRIIESGPTAGVLTAPQCSATKNLIAAATLVPTTTNPDPERTGRPVISLESVTKRFHSGKHARPALNRVSLTLEDGEVLGVLGQSGSGKSTLARLILGLETPDAGRIEYRPAEQASPAAARDTDVQLVFQDPYDAFDPRMTLQRSLEAPLLKRAGPTAAQRGQRINEVLREVGLGPELLAKHPGQCSGGQLQRLTIARALLLKPKVLVCDEATSALDSVTQRTVLDLLLRLQAEHGLSLVLISHDMNVIRFMSHRVAVLYQGELVELARTNDFFAHPSHSHSQDLVAASFLDHQQLDHDTLSGPQHA
jgi:peptide/nickel transport system ATP-binding protein